jgi:hypothetical protein
LFERCVGREGRQWPTDASISEAAPVHLLGLVDIAEVNDNGAVHEIA